MQWAKKQKGFTIVELLIVVVVIAILAAITIVSYNGIQNRAKSSVVQNDVNQAIKQLETKKIVNATQQYPSVAEANLKSSSGVTLSYSPNVTGNQYCVSAQNGSARYMASSIDTSLREGDCLVSDGLVVSVPMNGNASSAGSSSGAFEVSGATLATGQNGQANGAYQFGSNSNLSRSVPGAYQQLSASAWVYRDSTGSTPGLMNGISSTAPIHWEVASGSWRVRLGGVDQSGMVDAGPLQTWSHVAFTYDRTSGLFRYYMNGAVAHTYTGESGLNDYFQSNLVIGQSNGVSRQWLGRIDDVRVYDRIVSDSEMATIYSAGAQ